ncbi:MAG: hypothetical protein DME18_09150 [Verrucomicrobia bacterium]|nr:MAG: hypothetical protein DME18_09150 [Verrucomicrobiota bacterium]
MTNDKFRMSKETRTLKSESATPHASTISWSFVLRPSFDIRHSDFVIILSHEPIYELRMASGESSNCPLTTDT